MEILRQAMTIRLECRDLPAQFDGRLRISLGIQHKKEVVHSEPASNGDRVFEVPVLLRAGDFFGPFVHGPKGERFIYLVWSDDRESFRRAKIQLLDIPFSLLTKDIVVGRISMTDKRGGPLCASVRPPVVLWS